MLASDGMWVFESSYHGHPWAKKGANLQPMYQSEKPLWWLLLERDDGKFKAEWCF